MQKLTRRRVGGGRRRTVLRATRNAAWGAGQTDHVRTERPTWMLRAACPVC